MSRDRKILERHLRHWQEAGLVSVEQAENLRLASASLERGKTSGILRRALALLGGGLVLAGLVLIVAENWQALHRFVKLGGWAVLQFLFLGAAHRLGKRWPHFAEAFALLSAGWVLGGIALVSQIYHLDSRPPNGIWLWMLLVLPAVWILERRATVAMVFIALVAALALEVEAKDSWVHATTAEGPWLWLAIPWLGAAAVSFLPRGLPTLRERVGSWAFAAGTFFLLVFGAMQELDRSDLGRAWILAGASLTAALLVPARVFPAAWDAATGRAFVLMTFLPWIVVGARYDGGAIVDRVGVGLAWIAQLGVAALAIRAGARAGSRAWVNLGYAALLAGILTRYFDFFGDYLEGGAALVLTGLLLLFVLYTLEKARRRTLPGAAAS